MKRFTFTCLLLSLPTLAWAVEGRVITAVGDVRVLQADGQSLPARGGMPLQGAPTLTLGAAAYVQLRTEDGALIALPEHSELRFAAGAERQATLARGGVNLLADKRSWTILTPAQQVRVEGYARLRLCAAGCPEPPGLYGKVGAGEAVVEYSGGRAVLRGRAFFAPEGGGRPRLLARNVALLDDDPRLETAREAKRDLAQVIRNGLEDFRAGRFEPARVALAEAQQAAPAESILAYYLGLIALEQKQDEEALNQLRRYAREDAAGARERKVGQLITLLTANQLSQEVAQALRQEQALSNEPPEPNSIAVQPFVNRSSADYAPLAKGIAAMIISDLSKVPGLKVLERQKVQRILDEIRLGDSGLVDEAARVRAGRLMRAEKVVVGSFGVQ